VAVEPREFKSPGTKSATSDSSSAGTEATKPVVASIEPDAGDGKKKSLPLIPIIAGLIAVVVLGLLAKVLLAK
jgi:hypothetical protein